MSADLMWRELLKEVDRRIQKRLKEHRPSLTQTTGAIPGNQLPTAGNTGTGYTPTDHQSAHQASGGDELTGNLNAVARTDVRKNSTGTVFSRRRLNLIEGAGATLTVADDAGNEEIDITFTGPSELGYSAITADITTTSDTLVDATGLSVGVTIGTRGILVQFFAPEVRNSTDALRTTVEIYDDTGAARVQLGMSTSAVADGAGAMFLQARLTPAAGSRTYKVRWQRTDAAGTSTIRAAATSPAYIRVAEY